MYFHHFVFLLPSGIKHTYYVYVPRYWQWEAAGVGCVWGVWDCPVPDTADSILLQQTHCRAELSPSAKMVVPLGKHIKEKAKH